MTNERITLGQIIGPDMEEDFAQFDISEIQEVLLYLKEVDPIDLSHAESLQQKALRGADIISEFLGKLIKHVSYLETKINSTKNKASLEYKASDGKTTAEMRKQAGESSPEVEALSIKLAKAKGSKSVLEKKYDILIRTHHHYKEIAMGLKKTILGYSGQGQTAVPKGWE